VGENTTIGIVAHERRLARAEALRRSVGACLLSVDNGVLGCEANHLSVLAGLCESDADWVCVLEDDAVPVPEFRTHLTAALAFAPMPIVGLYLGTGNPSGVVQQRIGVAMQSAQAWIVGDCLIGSVGYCVRTALVSDMLRGIMDRTEELPLRISRWAQHSHIPICYTHPSLVNHCDDESIQGRPLTEHERRTGGARVAWCYGTRERWNTDAVELGHCPGWSA
jgi:hypothetical protein